MTAKPLTTALLLALLACPERSRGIRGGKIHEVVAFPFVVLPYGNGNGWTPGAGR